MSEHAQKALETVRLHLREVLVTTMPDEFKVPLRKALYIINEAIGNADGWHEQNTYGGVVDGLAPMLDGPKSPISARDFLSSLKRKLSGCPVSSANFTPRATPRARPGPWSATAIHLDFKPL